MADDKNNDKNVIRMDLEKSKSQFAAALPGNVRVERFMRIVLTAVNSDPNLIQADRRTLLEAAMKAAQDGLLPDGREAAFVIYNTNIGSKQVPRWIKKVQYMPMVAGILKKVRNSGELAFLDAVVVHDKDQYDSWTDESGPHFKYKRGRGDRGAVVMTFAYARTKDGAIFLEEMDEADMEAIRNVSRAKDSGPWSGPFADEMRRKSAIRRLAKYRLPTSTDVDDVIRRDDEFIDFSHSQEEQPKIEMPKRLSEQQPEHDDAREQPSDDESKLDPYQTLGLWVQGSPDEEFKAVNPVEFAARCKGLKGNELSALTKAYNERRKTGTEVKA